MKLLLDQGLPRSAAQLLREADIDAIHAGECNLAAASDEAILGAARKEGRVVVTLDADFHALLALSEATGPSVVRIRAEGLRGQALATLMQAVLKQCEADLDTGAMVTVVEGQIRVHHLPIGGSA